LSQKGLGSRRPIYSAALHRAAPPGDPPLGASKKPTWRRFVAYAFGAALLGLANPAGSPLAPWNLVGGAALCLFGAFWRIWGCGHLRKNQAVITSGPYAHVRNPLYLGTLLNLFGFCLAAGHPVIVYGFLPVGLLVFTFYYVPKKERVESERLRKRFGQEFETYHAAVPGYLPRITRWPQAGTERMSWPLVVENSEVETALLIVGGLAVLGARYFGIIPQFLPV
jgi:protein-S-isoprenylcysteine O-methyltransferase Ste14